MSLPGLDLDSWVLKRKRSGADEEGNPRTGLVTVATGVGAFGYASARELSRGAQLGQVIAGSLSVARPSCVFRIGDLLHVRGGCYRVGGIKTLVPHTRLVLETAENDGTA